MLNFSVVFFFLPQMNFCDILKLKTTIPPWNTVSSNLTHILFKYLFKDLYLFRSSMYFQIYCWFQILEVSFSNF